jgi:Mn2+/Fe2+ NRAMP family transporter
MKDSAGSPQSSQHHPGGLARFVRPALIASAVVAVVSIALLVIIFFLDAFNATVYSVGGNDIGDDTQEAQDIRGLYAGARAGSIVFLVASLMVAAAAAVLLYRGRNSAGEADGGEDVDFEDLGR